MLSVRDYGRVLELLQVDPSVRKVFFGDVRIPGPGVDQPPGSTAFPPALIPLWSETSVLRLFGYWKHWFCDRRPTFVMLDLEDGPPAIEVARSPLQLWMMAVNDSVDVEGELTADWETFGRTLELSEVRALERLTRSDARALRGLPGFEDAPARCFGAEESGYTGDFPRAETLRQGKSLRSVCSYELGFEEMAFVEAQPEIPPWLAGGDQEAVFEERMQKGDLVGAWMSLNSAGWYIVRARKALQQLADRSSDEAFRAMAGAWLGLPLLETDSY